MPINDALLGPVISAFSGILGVTVASVIVPQVRDHFSKARDARYLAIRVVCLLDRYVEDCASTAEDCGTDEPGGDCYARDHAPPPPTYPSDVNWKSIDHSLMYEIFELPASAERTAQYMRDVSENSTAGDDYLEERSYRYSRLGLQAYQLTLSLRKTYGIPEPANRVWDPLSHLREALQRRENWEARRAEAWPDVLQALPVKETVAPES